MPDLDERLAVTRTRLLDDIRVPDLGQIGRRAAALRRRRRAARVGGGLLALAAAGALAVPPWGGGTPPAGDTVPTPHAATPPPTAPPTNVYTDSGLTVHGLQVGAAVAEVPGDLRDVEFTDADRGWVLAADCTPPAATCQFTVARTTDGGRTWAMFPVTGFGAAPGDIPDLVALDGSTLVVRGAMAMISDDAGVTWRPEAAGGGGATIDQGARPLLRTGPNGSCADAVVEVWSPGYGYRGELAKQPPLDVCWIAGRAGADGAWWVGGTVPGTRQPAAAVTRDGGATWQSTEFVAPGDSVRVATLGDHTYAAVLTGDGEASTLRAIYHSARPGAPFERTWQGGGEPRTIGGEPVPLLDGRLLLADGEGHWFVSADDGRTFRSAGKLPHVSRLGRTPGGYVAFDIVAVGYAAFSSDGANWRKLHVH